MECACFSGVATSRFRSTF